MTSCVEWQGPRNKQGYGRTTVKDQGVRQLAHRYVWEQTHGPIPAGKILRHTCDNPPCVNLEHLELGTRRQNTQDMLDRGRSQKGEQHTQHKLTEQQVREILASSETRAQLAARYGISAQHVGRLKRREEWGHLDADTVYEKHHPKGTDNPNARMTADKVREMRDSAASTRELAEQFGISESTVKQIRSGKTWRHV